MHVVDLNSDLGESFGAYKLGCDEEVLGGVTSANIACGFHAGDPLVMVKTVDLAKKVRVAIGAHPGYPDLAGFGRRQMKCTAEQIYSDCLYQIGALATIAKSRGVTLQHVKPHGAMYNTGAKDLDQARAIAKAVKDSGEGLILMGLAGSLFEQAAQEENIPFASEAFADRAYMPDGTLVPRSRKGAVIHDAELAAQRVIRMVKEGLVETIEGKDIELKPDSICLHGDTPEAVQMAITLRTRLIEAGIDIKSLREVLKK